MKDPTYFICYIFEEQGVLGEDVRTVDMVDMNMADMEDMDMVDNVHWTWTWSSYIPRGSSDDYILPFFY